METQTKTKKWYLCTGLKGQCIYKQLMSEIPEEHRDYLCVECLEFNGISGSLIVA